MTDDQFARRIRVPLKVTAYLYVFAIFMIPILLIIHLLESENRRIGNHDISINVKTAEKIFPTLSGIEQCYIEHGVWGSDGFNPLGSHIRAIKGYLWLDQHGANTIASSQLSAVTTMKMWYPYRLKGILPKGITDWQVYEDPVHTLAPGYWGSIYYNKAYRILFFSLRKQNKG